MKKIYMIRHAKTQGNFKRRYIGKTDESLCEKGISELLKGGRKYTDVDIVFTSPMKRCIETADLIYQDKIKIQIPNLCECDFGIFENKTYEELKDNPDYQKWIDSGGKGDIPHGEDSGHFKKRCQMAFADILEKVYEDNIDTAAIIAHGGTFMAILEEYAPEKQDFYYWQIENCGMFELMIRNKKINEINR